MHCHLNAVTESHESINEVAFCFDRYYLNPTEHLFLRDGKPVELRPKLFETLHVLVANAGRLLTKSDLMSTIWPDEFVEEAGLARNICSLRDILHDHGHPPRFIETIPKFGYRFIGTVNEIFERRDPLSAD